MPSRDVNAATRLAGASWRRDKFQKGDNSYEKMTEIDDTRS